VGGQGLASTLQDSFTEWWLHTRKRIPKEKRKAFDSFTILCVWSLWLELNARLFDGHASSSVVQLNTLWSLADLWCRASFMLRSCLVSGIVTPQPLWV
jgi:hypothetical protein